MSDRAIVFIDGSNWYHSLKEVGISAPGDVDIAKLSRKLVGAAREWLSSRYYTGRVNQEKAVDVLLSVDLVLMGHRNEYDAAYLLTADGDYTPAVKAVREVGKKVYCASPATGAQLAAAANTFIPLKASFFSDCLY